MALRLREYNRAAAIHYADEWALSRNPRYYDYSSIGGDCTNFNSQCLYAGSLKMNYTRNTGWYYINPNNKSPSWTGVKYFYNFLVNNNREGPFGSNCNISDLRKADFIQLGNGDTFYHTLFVLDIVGEPTPNNIYIATHTYDAYYRPLSSYNYIEARYIHIEGVRY